MLDVLVLSDLWPPFPGGAERLMFNLARELQRRGLSVHVLTGYERADVFDGPPLSIRSIGVLDTRDEGWPIVSEFVETAQPRLVLTSHLYASQFADDIVTMGVPLVHVLLNGRRIPGAGLTVYISQWVHDRYDGTDDDLVILPPAFDDIVAEYHGEAIGFVKPIEHKGVELVYELAERLPDQRFVILRGEWQDIEIIRADLPNVEFLEPVDDMRSFYERCRLLLVPSRSEDAGTVAQEATLNGLPCISSDVGGLAETNGGGIKLPADDVEQWLAAIALLDDPVALAATVQRQLEHLQQLDHAGALDEFERRVRALLR